MEYAFVIIIVFLVLGVVSVLAEYISRRYKQAEIGRKLLHISGGLCLACILTFLPTNYTGIIGLIFIVGMIIARRFKWFSILGEKVARGYGEIYFMVGGFMIFVTSMWNLQFALIMIYILTLADGLAPFGRFIFQKKIYHKKTLGGSLVFFLISCTILMIFMGYSWQIIGIAMIITLSELFSHNGWDNIVLPLATFATLFLFHLF